MGRRASIAIRGGGNTRLGFYALSLTPTRRYPRSVSFLHFENYLYYYSRIVQILQKNIAILTI